MALRVSPADYGTLIAITAERTKRMRRLRRFLCDWPRLAVTRGWANSAGAANARSTRSRDTGRCRAFPILMSIIFPFGVKADEEPVTVSLVPRTTG